MVKRSPSRRCVTLWCQRCATATINQTIVDGYTPNIHIHYVPTDIHIYRIFFNVNVKMRGAFMIMVVCVLYFVHEMGRWLRASRHFPCITQTNIRHHNTYKGHKV